MREDELESWFDFVGLVFSKAQNRSYFVRHWQADPHRNINGIFVCTRNSEIVGTLRVFHREVYIAGKNRKMGGLGEVSTHKEFRRRGIASKLLKMALCYMEENGMEISMLSGDQSIYTGVGYKKIECAFLRTVVSIDKPSPQGPYNITKTKFTDLSAIQKEQIQSIYNANLKYGGLVRTPEYWESWVAAELALCEHTYLIEHSGKVLAFLHFTLENPRTLSIKEFDILPEIFEDTTERKNFLVDSLSQVLAGLQGDCAGEYTLVAPAVLGPFGKVQEDFKYEGMQILFLKGCSEAEEAAMSKFLKESWNGSAIDSF
uniref:N-acetyltransferase domain-containing protein n=1 Tax=Arcella intermedia TaxID=1963864 RepID=A0A6B2LAW5_9EUKA